jgi:translation initiation factor 3 subunit C
VVKSAKDRVIDALRECVIKVNNGLKNMDWAIVEDEFANTNKKLEKSKNQLVNGTPKFYVKMLAAVEDSVTEVVKDKPKFKAMKPAIQRIVNRMKLNVKKHNKNFESDIEDFRARPDAYDTEEEADSDSDDDDSDSDSDSDADEAADSDSDDDMMKKPKAKVSTILSPQLSLPSFFLPSFSLPYRLSVLW